MAFRVFSRWRRRREALMCRQVVELITEYLEGALDNVDRQRLEAHLADCPHCTEYLRQFRLTIDAMGRIEPEELDDEARTDLVDLYRRWRTA